MKTRALLFALAVLALAACNRQPETKTFKVSVDLANTEGKTAYLMKNGQKLDSAELVNWKAEFNTPVCKDNEMYGLMLKGWRRPFMFFTDNKDVQLEGDAQNPNNIIVKGSESQARLDAFNEGYAAFDTKLDSLGQLLQQAKENGGQEAVQQLQQQYADMEEIQKMYCFDYVWENPKDAVAHYVLYRYKWAFSPCELRTMIDNIHSADSTITSGSLQQAEDYLVKQERVQAGQPMLDFTQDGVDGQPLTLSELAAGTKLLLVDFWASWCPDCRKENPNVVAAYQKFHEKGFDILGVSYDTDAEAWKAAIEKDGLTWHHVSDLKGWSNATSDLYAISFIPQNALIKDGMIVARNLEGEELMEEIERQLAD